VKREPALRGDPLVQARLELTFRGRKIELLAPHSAFSSSRIDAGTRLLLDTLPPGEPETFLDLGCGYGALGIPIASAFAGARGLLCDRDLLAVEFAKRNAALAGTTSVEVAASLGYRDLPRAWEAFDWILFNAPARAGPRAIGALIAGGRTRLRPGGLLRMVVIAPLADAVGALPGAELAGSSRSHAVFSFPPGPGGEPEDDDYLRDRIELELPEKLVLERPTDLADEPHRLPHAVPLIAAHLPERAPARALAFRAGYGLMPALLLARYPETTVDAIDRDLLGIAFARRNLTGAGARASVLASLGFERVHGRGPYDLITGEILSPLGPRAIVAELLDARGLLAPGGAALVLGLHKHRDDLLAKGWGVPGISVAARSGPVALYRIEA